VATIPSGSPFEDDSTRSTIADSVSRWVDTEMYSPVAIEKAPALRAAMPAVAMTGTDWVAAATPITVAATETMPSFAPSTPARSLFSLADVDSG